MIRIYLDSGVLIGGARGVGRAIEAVYDLVEDPEREFVPSLFVRLEMLPKAAYHRRSVEMAFYHGYFGRVVAWSDLDNEVVRLAEQEALRLGLSAIDALNLASAIALNADELITSERPTKPIHRVTGVAEARRLWP